MKQFYKEILDNYFFFISLFIIAVIWQILQISHSPYSREVAEVFIGLAMVGFFKDISIKSIYFYIFLVLSILMFVLLSFSSLLISPYTKVAFDFLIVIILLGYLKDIIIKSIYFYIVLLVSIIILIIQYMFSSINIPWYVYITFFIITKIKSRTKTANEEVIAD